MQTFSVFIDSYCQKLNTASVENDSLKLLFKDLLCFFEINIPDQWSFLHKSFVIPICRIECVL